LVAAIKRTSDELVRDPHSLELSILKNSQELRLEFQGKFPNFAQEQRWKQERWPA
jgi:hypothetical protein